MGAQSVVGGSRRGKEGGASGPAPCVARMRREARRRPDPPVLGRRRNPANPSNARVGEARAEMSDVRESRLRRWTSCTAVACAIAIGLASSGTVSASTPTAGASQSGRRATGQTSLCASSGNVTHLVVRRTDALAQDELHFSFPSSVAVSDVASVRDVARALCALPAMPKQVMSCPMDLGIDYRLQFSRAQRRFRVVTLDATGCQVVDGLVPPRWIARSPRFWGTLGGAMRLRHPSWLTFRGSEVES